MLKKNAFLFFLSLMSLSNSLNADDKKFAIVIPSYKNALYYKKNLDSVVNQKYDKSKFRIVYIDDASPFDDNTAGLVENYIKENNLQSLVTLRKNKVRRGAMANLWSEISLCDPEETVVMVDGDDALKDENVLSYLNEVYSNPNVWLTYGQYECDPIEAGIGFAANYSDEVIKNRDFRKNFLATHLRTYKAWLFQNIKLEDFIYDNAFLVMTWDLAIMFPALEMCGEKFKFISKILYKYNMNNSLSDYKTDPTLMFYLADYYKTQKPKYEKLDQPKFIPALGRFKDPAAVGFVYGIDKYLSPGADINARDFKGRTALVQAIKFGFQSLIEFLIKKGADVNLPDYDGLTPLMYSIIFADTNTFKTLIANGADVNKFNNFGANALTYAKKFNKNEIIQLIQSSNPKKEQTVVTIENILPKIEQSKTETTLNLSVTEQKLNKYRNYLENGTYEGQDWSSFSVLPKSRYHTFKKAFEYFEKNNGKVIVELGTTRSFVHGGLPGCNSDDVSFWQPNNPETWDWGAGVFTRVVSECLSHLNPKIHTVDIIENHIKRSKVVTQPFSNLIEYHVKSSLEFLNEFKEEKSIDLLYLDTGDITPIDPSAFLQLEEAKIIVERNLLSDDGIILIDDVKNQTPKKFGEKSNLGKSKYALPYLLRHGFEILEDGYQVILRKKK